MLRQLQLSLLLLAVVLPAAAQQRSRLTVSTTVPPRLCEHPAPCATADRSPNLETVVVIEDDSVRYIGTTPAVTRRGEYLIVKF